MNYLERDANTEIKRCPKCRSFYVTEQECESCGLQLTFDPVGEPFGKRSLYGMGPAKLRTRDNVKRYRQWLLHRLGLLQNYFTCELQDDRRKLFLIELRELVSELLRYGEECDFLLDKLSHLGPLSQQLLAQALQEQQQLDAKSKRFSRIFSYRLGGGIRIGTLVLFFLASAIWIWGALELFRYLALR